MTDNREVLELPSPDALSAEAALRFITLARESIADHGGFFVALSGGSTPRAMYARLASPDMHGEVDWQHVHLFFSDERFVPGESTESNFHTASEELIKHVPIPPEQVHPYQTVGVEPADAARRYEGLIRETVSQTIDSTPSFDLIFLGMGPDGHTASLFPGTPALGITDRLVVENFVPKVDMWRLTFTYPLLNAGRTVAFLVQGDDKKQPVSEILGGTSSLPAAGVRPVPPGKLLWLLDRTAASEYDDPQSSDGSASPTKSQ